MTNKISSCLDGQANVWCRQENVFRSSAQVSWRKVSLASHRDQQEVVTSTWDGPYS